MGVPLLLSKGLLGAVVILRHQAQGWGLSSLTGATFAVLLLPGGAWVEAAVTGRQGGRHPFIYGSGRKADTLEM